MSDVDLSLVSNEELFEALASRYTTAVFGGLAAGTSLGDAIQLFHTKCLTHSIGLSVRVADLLREDGKNLVPESELLPDNEEEDDG